MSEHLTRVMVDRHNRRMHARCSCGWKGKRRRYRWEALFDARAHREGWQRG